MATPEQDVRFQPPSADGALTVHQVARTIYMHRVSSEELDMIASLSNSIYLTFFGISAGSFISFWITIKTVSLTLDLNAMFIAFLWASGLSCAFFGVQSIVGYIKSRATLSRIKSEGEHTPQ